MSAYLDGVSRTEQMRIQRELEDRFRESLDGVCRQCGEKKTADQFSWQLSSSPPYRNPKCKACQSMRERKVRANGGRLAIWVGHVPGTLTISKRRAILEAIKRTVGCTDCGSHIGPLEFDHLPGFVKHFTIGGAVQNPSVYSDEALFVEVAKCEVVCPSCHLERTLDRRKRGVVVPLLNDDQQHRDIAEFYESTVDVPPLLDEWGRYSELARPIGAPFTTPTAVDVDPTPTRQIGWRAQVYRRPTADDAGEGRS